MAVGKTSQKNESRAEKVESRFSKEQLLSAEYFQERRDIVNALLSKDEEYTVKAVEQMIDNYMKGQVK